MADKYSELKKIIAEVIGVNEQEITDRDIEELLNLVRTEIYLKKFRQST